MTATGEGHTLGAKVRAAREVRRYAQIAQMDCARVHAKASPVDNWKL